MKIHAKHALLAQGWATDVRIAAAQGRITAVTPDVSAAGADFCCDYLVPGGANLHSHAFQRGFAGLTERRGQGRDSFWSWREMMYHFALSLTPEQMQIIAEMAYIEMLEAGYTRVGEFHYLHHDQGGRPYANPAELSERIFAAAHATGIALTHLPVFYAHAGFGPEPAQDDQRRFLHDIDSYLRLIQAADRLITRPQDRVGMAPHSLRAATLPEITALIAAQPGRIMHIHISEQTAEVDACLAATGQRPVDYLYGALPVDARWCLIHATHITPAERALIARSGAVAGLCPITEANLGDGIFPAAAYLAEGGRLGIGTDSNIEISLRGELKLLEYGQRLAQRERNLLIGQPGSVGLSLFLATQAGAAQALGADQPVIAPGGQADLVALHDPLGLPPDSLLDRWIFGRDIAVSDVWAAGRHLVQGGQHIARAPTRAAYRKVLRDLLA